MSTNQDANSLADRVAFLSGQWIQQSEMSVAVNDVGFLQAATGVERLRTYGGRLFRVDAHLQRWAETIQFLQIEKLPQLPVVKRLIDELLDRNPNFVTSQSDVGVTLFATPGRPHAGPTFGIHLNPIDGDSNRRRITQGQSLVITDVVQPSPLCWPRGVKVRSRLHYYNADRVTQRITSDGTGVLVETDGSLTETGIANLAVVIGSTIHSPPDETILHGVTQQFVEQLAEQQSINWTKLPLTRQLLVEADEVLLMGTTTGLWFAGRYCFGSQHDTQSEAPDWQPLAAGGPVFRTLRRSFDSAVHQPAG